MIGCGAACRFKSLSAIYMAPTEALDDGYNPLYGITTGFEKNERGGICAWNMARRR